MAYLVYDGDLIIGIGRISLCRVVPTYHNPAGMEAYIMNTYTDLEYRRKGIATKTSDLPVQEAWGHGIRFITPEATDMRRSLCERHSFCQTGDGMYLPEQPAVNPSVYHRYINIR